MRLVIKPLCGIIIKFEEDELEEAEIFLKTMAEGLMLDKDEKSKEMGKQILEFLKQISDEGIGSA